MCLQPPGLSSWACVPNQAQQGGRQGRQGSRPPLRQHTIVQSHGIKHLYPALAEPVTETHCTATIEGPWRVIRANGIAEHKTGRFPNPGNPNRIGVQHIVMRVPAQPVLTDTATPVKEPGVAVNGVIFDPGAAEFYKGDPTLGWQYEALSGALPLGFDESHAHVQPTGKYHYHGLPTLLMANLKVQADHHSPQVGWAADGFPIYALYGFSDPNNPKSEVVEMTASYQLKPGKRPTANGQPGGRYDGTFTADYTYTAGAGSLDECNGTWTVTPDHPEGTYAYFLTRHYPFVPRCVKGQIDPTMVTPPIGTTGR
ncbi:MAG: YHYH protein [Vampirovibrionales bacterium]